MQFMIGVCQNDLPVEKWGVKEKFRSETLVFKYREEKLPNFLSCDYKFSISMANI